MKTTTDTPTADADRYLVDVWTGSEWEPYESTPMTQAAAERLDRWLRWRKPWIRTEVRPTRLGAAS